MKRRNRKVLVAIVILLMLVLMGYLLLYGGYRQSLQSSGNRAETLAAQMQATALATLTQ